MTDPKAFSTLQAKAAMRGMELSAIRTDAERWSYVLTSAAITRELESLEAVQAWLVGPCDQLAGATATEGTDAP